MEAHLLLEPATMRFVGETAYNSTTRGSAMAAAPENSHAGFDNQEITVDINAVFLKTLRIRAMFYTTLFIQ